MINLNWTYLDLSPFIPYEMYVYRKSIRGTTDKDEIGEKIKDGDEGIGKGWNWKQDLCMKLAS